MDNLVSLESISFILVFLGGVLSFLSPCVIPLIPVYMGYLAGGAKQTDENGQITYKRAHVFLHTVFFVLGISSAFFLLGMATTALGTFFTKNQLLFTRVGGILIIALGLYQIGLLDFKFLQKERKIRLNLSKYTMNPLIAFFMGFTFSFAWTPCVGPALSSVLIFASGAKSTLISNLLILLYTAGFVIPFLLLGLFTTQLLNFLKGRQKLLKYTVKIAGVILIVIGIMTFTGWMNGISKYLNKISQPLTTKQQIDKDRDSIQEADNNDNNLGNDILNDDNISDDILDKDNTFKDNNSSEIISGDDMENADISDDDMEDADISEDGIDNADDSSKDTSETDTSTDAQQTDTNQSKVFPAIDFTLTDQYGIEHTLSDYKDKVVFLNFWATWCPPCIKEMPDIERIFIEYGKNQEDVIILGVANPSSDQYPNNADGSKDEIIAFLDENEFTFPVVFDETGDLLREYAIRAFPTTFLIDKDGNIYGYVAAMLTKDMMDSAISQTLNFAVE